MSIESAGRLLLQAKCDPITGTQNGLRALTVAKTWIKYGGTVLLQNQQWPAILRHRFESIGCTAWCPTSPSRIDWQFAIGDCQVLDVVANAIRVVTDTRDNQLDSTITVVLDPFSQAAQNDRFGSVLAGQSFAILADHYYSQTRPLPRNRAGVRRCLVCFPDFDVDQIVEALLCLDQRLGRKVNYDVVCNNIDFLSSKLIGMDDELAQRLSFHRNIDHVFALIGQADLAICNNVAVFFELAYCGMPSLLVRPMATGADWCLDCLQPDWLGDAAHRLRQLSRDFYSRLDLGRRLQHMVDGYGARRVCQEMLARSLSAAVPNIRDKKSA